MKKFFIYFLTIVAALMLGTALAAVLQPFDSLNWLIATHSIGFNAFSCDLYVLDLTLGFHVRVSVIQIIMLILSIFIAPKMESVFAKSKK